MFLEFLVSAIPLAVRLYLNIFIYWKDKKTVLNLISFLAICSSSIYFFGAPFASFTFPEYLPERTETHFLFLLTIFVLDAVTSIFQSIRVFVVKFGVRIRIYRCASTAMLALVFMYGVAIVFADL
ncbi:hypothetical protein [uncultured Roseibium sp.]|uniref:hypothetical protein n=1 Tax=uncultured Roseibium sp. TaxID=1936171 RepID=UPI002628DEC8|nr:hypothetical protein [uncultured Roseibium sp.]